MNRPHVDQIDRDTLDDLGLVDDDHSTKNAPGRCCNTAEGRKNNPLTKEQEF